jgi:RNA polymerase sigma factor (sigma-70 family)
MSTTAELIERIKSREADTLRSLFSEINPYLAKILAGHRLPREQVHDILQDTWLTFFKNISQYKGESQIKVFVAGIMLNKLREAHRTQNRYSYEDDSEKFMQSSFNAEGWWNVRSHGPSESLQHKETARFIADCLDGLSASQREAFILREIEDKNTEEICNILDLNVSHLGVLIYRAKDKLRQCLEGKAGEMRK